MGSGESTLFNARPLLSGCFRLAGALAVLAAATPVLSQETRATVSAMLRETRGELDGGSTQEVVSVTSPGELCLVRASDLLEVDRLAIDDELAAGDILSRGPCDGSAPVEAEPDPDPSTELLVELTCGEGTVLRFAGSFKVLIREPEAADCAVELPHGTLDLLTDQPAEVTTGGVTIGVEGTRLTLRREEGSERGYGYRTAEERITCLLFDGRVRIGTGGTAEARPQTIVLEAGDSWTRKGREISRGPIAAEDFPAVAGRSARLDLARATLRGTLPPSAEPFAQAVERLGELYSSALAEPRSVALRAELARTLLDYGLADRARLEATHAGLVTDDELRRHAIDPDRLTVPRELERRAPEDGGEAGGAFSSGEPSAVQKVPLATVHGPVMVTLPRDLRGGERISGSLEVSGAGEGSEARKNLEKLEGFEVAIGDEVVPARDGTWSARLPAGESLQVALRNHRGKAQVKRSLELAEPADQAAGTTLTAPASCRSGVPLIVTGAFDGDAGTTRVALGGRPLAVLAETPRSVLVDCPGTAAGAGSLTVEEGGERLELPHFRVFDLVFDVREPALTRGQVSAAVLELRGLAGLDRPIGVRIRNQDPKIVRLEGGDEQLLTFSPADWGTEGVVRRTLRVVGRKDGTASFEVELVHLPERRVTPP